MKFLNLKSIKLFFGKKYLDWAEILPKFQGGVIHSLQLTRESQRRRSEQCYMHSRSPEGSKIKYKELVLIDIFELEEIEYLSNGLSELFPNKEKIEGLIREIEKNVGSLSSSGWYRAGVVTKSRCRIIGEKTIDPSLPSKIDYVSVWVSGITPSVTAIAFVFTMTDEVTTELDRLYNRHYLPDTEFRKIIPWGVLGGGHSQNSVEAVMQRNILNYTKNIREECGKWVSNYFKVLIQDIVSAEKLPVGAIEIFQIVGAPYGNEEKLKKWKEKARDWNNALGISLDDASNFTQEQYIFCWASTGRDQQIIPARIVMLSEDQHNKLEFIVHSFIAPMALDNYISALRKAVEQLRVDVYRVTKTFSEKITERNVKNSLLLKRGVMILDRMKIELSHNEKWFFYLMESLSDFKSIQMHDKGKTLDKVFYEHIIHEIEHIEKHSEIAERNITDYINGQNILAMFTLQNKIFYLTIIMTLFAIISVLVNFEKLIEIWNIFFAKN